MTIKQALSAGMLIIGLVLVILATAAPGPIIGSFASPLTSISFMVGGGFLVLGGTILFTSRVRNIFKKFLE